MKPTKGERVFDVILCLIVIFICIATVYPFLYSLLMSFSPRGITSGKNTLQFIIDNLSLSSWKAIVSSGYMWRGFYNSVVRTIVGSLVSVIFTITMAYPLAKNFVFKKPATALLIFSMMFGAGMIPSYILISNLHMMDTFWVLILPGSVSAFNIIVMRNFFNSIPASLEESAKLEGANDLTILIKIVIPLSTPAIATIALWCIVGNWNSWFDVVLYINSREKYLLPAILRELVTQGTVDDSFRQSADVLPDSESLQAAATMFTTIPVLLTYPFLQKYFTKGIMMGAIKE